MVSAQASLYLLHLSDLHFGSDRRALNDRQLKEGLASVIEGLAAPPLVVVSGDVTYQGGQRGFEAAANFFRSLVDEELIEGSSFLACPGNHDLQHQAGSAFAAFDRFVYSVRRDRAVTYSDRSWLLLKVAGFNVLLVNSAHHCDHTHGEVSEDLLRALRLDRAFTELTGPKVAVLHHHLLGVLRDDTSTLRNAYPLMYELDRLGFDAILHGHQHAGQALPVGRAGVRIFSARSANFNEPGIMNGMTALKFGGGDIDPTYYAFSHDVRPYFHPTNIRA